MTLAFLEDYRVHYTPGAVYRYHLRLSSVEDYLGRAAGVFLVGYRDYSAFGLHSGGRTEGVGVALLSRHYRLTRVGKAFVKPVFEKLFILVLKKPAEHIKTLFLLLEKAEVGGGRVHSHTERTHVGDNVA